MKLSPLKELLLGALLWLPMCFFLWFWLASPLVLPVTWLSGLALHVALGDLIADVTQFGYVIEVTTRIRPAIAAADGEGVPVVALDVNPMIYGYGLPLFTGLTLATPMAVRRRLVQILIGYAALVPVQAWGVFWQVMRTVGLDLGEPGTEAVRQAGFNLELIALCYQFGYLILPSVTPVVIWVLGNRAFLERLIARRPPGETGRAED